MVIFFAWSFLKSAGTLYALKSSPDYELFSAIGIGSLFYTVAILLMLFEAYVAYLLFTQKSKACFFGKWLVISEVLGAAMIAIVTMLHIEKAKSIHVAYRAASGMKNPSDVDFVFSNQGIGFALLEYAVLYAVVYYFIFKIKPELINNG